MATPHQLFNVLIIAVSFAMIVYVVRPDLFFHVLIMAVSFAVIVYIVSQSRSGSGSRASDTSRSTAVSIATGGRRAI